MTSAAVVSSQAGSQPGQIMVNAFDGTRQLMPGHKNTLLSIRDGFQNLTRVERAGPSIDLEGLNIYNNLGDNYAVVAWVDGYRQAGFYPVKVEAGVHLSLDLMLVPKNASFHFAQARWPNVQAERPQLAKLFAAGTAGDASEFYDSLIESGAPKLACLLNITTAMSQIFLPQGTPLDYFEAIKTDDLRPDRFYAWAQPALEDQVKVAVQQKEFVQEPSIDLLLHSKDPQYGVATSSYKQVQFGEANVQLTFHGDTRKEVNGIDCVLVEPDIDYYKDTAAHVILEVIPNFLTGNLTDPKVVYVLRWITGRHAGIPEFDPLYTLE